MPFISATNRITLWPQESGGRTRLLGRRRPASALKAAGPIRSKCDNHRTWRGASSGILCLSINMTFGPAHKPESERSAPCGRRPHLEVPGIRSSAPSLWSAAPDEILGAKGYTLIFTSVLIERNLSPPKFRRPNPTSRPLKTGRGRDLGHVFHHFYLVFHESQRCYLEGIWRSLEWSNSAARAVRGPRINKMRLRNHKQPCHQIEPVDSHRALSSN